MSWKTKIRNRGFQRYKNAYNPFTVKGNMGFLRPGYKRLKWGYSKNRLRRRAGRYPFGISEIKYMYEHDTITTTTSDDDGAFKCLNDIATGDTDITRIGNKIELVDISFRWSVKALSSMDDPRATLRIMLVWYPTPHGAGAPATESLLEYAHPLSHLCKETARRYQILYSRIVGIEDADTTGAGRAVITGKCYRKLTGKYTSYLTTTSGSANIEHGMLLLFIISDQATSGPEFTYYIKTRFKDA